VSLYLDASLLVAIFIEDDGIGQAPERMHETLLSLGSSDKGDKQYLIGLFGQGGSSTYAASEYSWCVSRRAPEVLDGKSDGVGWTVVRQVFPKARRDPYYAYLAAHPSGQVPALPGSAADAQHLAAEFSGRFYTDRKALPAEALHCNTSYLTAVANDYSYDVVYSRIIDGIGQVGDVLVGLSTSGNSKNIIKAFEKAREKDTGKKPRKAAAGQREMLLPISGSGKRAAKEEPKQAPKKADKTPARAAARSKKAG